MAKETFSIIAIEETQHWAEGLLEENGIEAAFGFYLIRHGERTHICSFTPNSWCYWIRNEFVYDCDNETAHDFVGDHECQAGESGYFGFINPETMDPRFIAETFTIEIEDDLTPEGRETDAYHTAVWKEAEEIAHEFDCNGLDAKIIWTPVYRAYQNELLAKRYAENVKPLAGREQLPLFVMQAKRDGITTYEQAREAGLI